MMKNFLLFPTVGIMIAGSVIGCKPETNEVPTCDGGYSSCVVMVIRHYCRKYESHCKRRI